MKKIKLLLICIFGIFIFSACKRGEDNPNTPINPNNQLEEGETILKTLYASSNEKYANTIKINEYYIELTNKGNFFFTEQDSEALQDNVISSSQISYKGTYEETDTKLLLNYKDLEIMEYNEFTKVDGLYLYKKGNLAFSTRKNSLSESSYLGLYYSVIDESIYSIELMENNEAIVKIEDETYYSDYVVNVSNIYIRDLDMNLILNGTTLIYNEYIFKRNTANNVNIVGYITNLKQSIGVSENLDLVGKYIDVCYSDFTKKRYYLTDDLLSYNRLETGLNNIKIKLDDIEYDYELYLIDPIEFVNNRKYESLNFEYFKIDCSKGNIIKYNSLYNLDIRLLNSDFDEVESSNSKNDYFILDETVSTYYIQVVADEISISLEQISRTETYPFGEYEFRNDSVGVYLNLKSDYTFEFYLLSTNESKSLEGEYTYNNGIIDFKNFDLLVYGDNILYEDCLLEKKTHNVIFAYVIDESDSLISSSVDLKVSYLTNEGIFTEKVIPNNIIGERENYLGKFDIAVRVSDYYAFLEISKNIILNYNDISLLSNINSNIFYSFTGYGEYLVGINNIKEEYEINMYDSNFNLLKTISSDETVDLNGEYYFSVKTNSTDNISLKIEKTLNNNLEGIYESDSSIINFDDLTFDSSEFTFDDENITVDGSILKYEYFGDILIIDGIVYNKINDIENDIYGVYQVESNNEVLIIEISKEDLTYFYNNINAQTVTEYDIAVEIDDYIIKSKIGNLYYYNKDGITGILYERDGVYLNFVKTTISEQILQTRVTFNKTTYFIGDSLESSDIEIVVLYKNGSISNVSFTEDMIKYFSTKAVGNMKYILSIGNDEYACNYQVLAKDKVYANREFNDSNITSKVYEFKSTKTDDYLISISVTNYSPFKVYVYSDYSLKNLMTTFDSNVKYASELVNCNYNETYYILVEFERKSDLSIYIEIDDSLIGTYKYDLNTLVFNSNKTFEFNDIVNNVRYIGTYKAINKHNYNLTVSKQYQIEGNAYNEVEITVQLIQFKSYGDVIILENNNYIKTMEQISYVGTFYRISDGVVEKIELTSNQSLGGGLLKYSMYDINGNSSSNSSTYQVTNSILQASYIGYLYKENNNIFLIYNDKLYIKSTSVENTVNSQRIEITEISLKLNELPSIKGNIFILNNDCTYQRIAITNSMISDYNTITNSVGEKKIIIQYMNIAFELFMIVEE